MASPQVDKVGKIFDIIAAEVGVSRDELTEDAEFWDFGIDGFLARTIISKIAEVLKIKLPPDTFDDYPTVGELQTHLSETYGPVVDTKQAGRTSSLANTVALPLSMVLQGKPETSKKTLFLLPDGSGSAMAYVMLPVIDKDVCLIALNSPYLQSPSDTKFTVEGIAATFAEEIQNRQPKGPYLLGGWSAGGYYSFEVMKYLLRKGQKVEKLILIDSPCRLIYEELPMDVVHYLSNNNLMGNWGDKKPPAWMVNHFDISIKAISHYIPTPMRGPELPDVSIIWAQEGVLKEDECEYTGLDFDVKVTQMLIRRPVTDGALGWDGLFPGARLSVSKTTGNHFTMVFKPNCDTLSALLKDAIQEHDADRLRVWQEI